MEKERDLEKLRRLRCRADYPVRLFLSAVGRLHWIEESRDEGVRIARGSGTRPTVPMMVWRPGERGCPYCGRNVLASRVRRAGMR